MSAAELGSSPEDRIERALASLVGESDLLRRASRLRAMLGEELGREAANLAELRRRAMGRLPHAERLFLDARRLEQATHRNVATSRASRIGDALPGARVLDATAGIGGDSLVLAERGLALVAADADGPTTRRLRRNLLASGLDVPVVQARAEERAVLADVLVLDPDRRGPSGRRVGPGAMSPDLATALRLAAAHAGASVQLAPGTDPELVLRVREELGRPTPLSLEWVSLNGELRELGLWTGSLANPEGPALREVRLLGGGGSSSWASSPREVRPLSEARALDVRWIAEPDPAVIRSGLVGALAHELGLAPLGPGLAYLGGEEAPPTPDRRVRLYRVLDAAPADRRRVRALLARHDVGPLVVKKRGHPRTSAELARDLAGRGSRTGLLIVARLVDSHRAYLVESAP